MAPERILVVEDDPAITLGLCDALRDEGFDVVHAACGDAALDILTGGRAGPAIHLVLLDVRLGPGPDGFTVCRRLREAGLRMPVLMLTARDEEVDRVLGLELGADDYVVKPYSLREFQSRIRAHLRRAYGTLAATAATPLISFGSCVFDTQSLRLYRGGREENLTPVELRLLRYFLDNPDMALSRRRIIDSVWGNEFILEDDRTVDVHIRHLREKIEIDPAGPRHVQTVRGHGYRFVVKP
jgi:DNA-binding response OmpR family regulator